MLSFFAMFLGIVVLAVLFEAQRRRHRRNRDAIARRAARTARPEDVDASRGDMPD